MKSSVKTRMLLVAALLCISAVVVELAAAAEEPKVDYYLTILHNNDAESQLINAGGGLEDFGGAARFLTVLQNLRREAVVGIPPDPGAKRGVMVLSAGDSFVSGPEFGASLAHGVPFYDTVAMELIGYDVVTFGHHDFDFGPDVLADFLAGYVAPPAYVAANLDFAGEPALQAYVTAGVIAPAFVVKERGEEIGVIGLDTPNLPYVSSPRNVVVADDLADLVQSQIDLLEQQGVNKIVLLSHLMNIENERMLLSQLSGVDVVVAGGGGELLANPDDLLVPGDELFVYGAYPQTALDANGDLVPLVTTSGDYKYVGRLVVGFDKSGEVIVVDPDRSGPVRVATDDCSGFTPCDDAVLPDPLMQVLVVDPVSSYIAGLDTLVIGTSEVDLDGLRDHVRSVETNLGNLMADSQKWRATQLAPAFGVPAPDVALQNGGGIRNNSIVPAGDITELDTYMMAPFPNFLAIVPGIPREQLKEILENAVACSAPGDICGSGRFAQVAGLRFDWTASGVAQILDLDGNVVQPGSRVREVSLDDGTVIVAGGVVVPGPEITVATLDFLARGGDQYPFRGAEYTLVGVTYQQALRDYIATGLGGLISAAGYPEGGEGRITQLP